MQAIRNYKCVFGRNLYNNETNSILDIRLAPQCPVFVKTKSTFLTVADFFKPSCSDASHFDAGLILYFVGVQTQEQKYTDAHCKTVH